MRKRNNNISFRVNDDEKILFDSLQKKTGLPKNKLIIRLLSSSVLLPEECITELKNLNKNTAQLTEQVKRIGVNINQIARIANCTGTISDIHVIDKFNNSLNLLRKECEKQWQFINQSIHKLH